MFRPTRRTGSSHLRGVVVPRRYLHRGWQGERDALAATTPHAFCTAEQTSTTYSGSVRVNASAPYASRNLAPYRAAYSSTSLRTIAVWCTPMSMISRLVLLETTLRKHGAVEVYSRMMTCFPAMAGFERPMDKLRTSRGRGLSIREVNLNKYECQGASSHPDITQNLVAFH